MKHKIYFFLLVAFQAGCAVELRDHKQQEELPLTELKVDNEYSLPIPLNPSEQRLLRYDRLILGRKAQFITQGLNVRIEVKELIADDATIRTFKSDQVTAQGFNGHSGGHLELFAKRATGKLNIIMQGEKGGMGAEGAAANETLRGAKGANGEPAIFNRSGYTSYLVARATNGAQGAPGLQGFSGGDGLRGGDSGTAFIEIASTEDFNIEIQKNPGSGGKGGIGGPGGAGGFGGEPGLEAGLDFSSAQVHNYTVPGPQGIQGPQGPAGKIGTWGLKEKSCVQVNSDPLACE